MEFYVLKSYNHISFRANKKPRLHVGTRARRQIFTGGMEYISDKMPLSLEDTISNYPMVRIRSLMSNSPHGRCDSTLRAEIIVTGDEKNKSIKYRYTAELLSSCGIVAQYVREFDRPVKFAKIDKAIAAPKSANLEPDYFVPVAQEMQARTLFPLVVTELPSIYHITCPVVTGFRGNGHGTFASLTVAALAHFINSFSGEIKYEEGSLKYELNVADEMDSPSRTLKNIFISILAKFKSFVSFYLCQLQGDIGNLLSEGHWINNVRFWLKMLSVTTFFVDSYYSNPFDNPEPPISNLDSPLNEDPTPDISFPEVAYYLNIGRYLLNISEKEMTKDFLCQLLSGMEKVKVTCDSCDPATDIFKDHSNKSLQQGLTIESLEKMFADYLRKTNVSQKGLIITIENQAEWNQLLWWNGAAITGQPWLTKALHKQLEWNVMYEARINKMSLLYFPDSPAVIRLGVYLLTINFKEDQTIIYLLNSQLEMIDETSVKPFSRMTQVVWTDHAKLNSYIILVNHQSRSQLVRLYVCTVGCIIKLKAQIVADWLSWSVTNAIYSETAKEKTLVVLPLYKSYIFTVPITQEFNFDDVDSASIIKMVDLEKASNQTMDGVMNMLISEQLTCYGVLNSHWLLLAKWQRPNANYMLVNIKTRTIPILHRVTPNIYTDKAQGLMHGFSIFDRLYVLFLGQNIAEFYLVMGHLGKLSTVLTHNRRYLRRVHRIYKRQSVISFDKEALTLCYFEGDWVQNKETHQLPSANKSYQISVTRFKLFKINI